MTRSPLRELSRGDGALSPAFSPGPPDDALVVDVWQRPCKAPARHGSDGGRKGSGATLPRPAPPSSPSDESSEADNGGAAACGQLLARLAQSKRTNLLLQRELADVKVRVRCERPRSSACRHLLCTSLFG